MRALVPSLAGALVLGALTAAIGYRARTAPTTLPSVRFEDLVSAKGSADLVPKLALLRAAAEGGDVEAQVTLGRIALVGVSVLPRDAMQAARWLERAAAVGHPWAAHTLAGLYLRGEGVPVDPARARSLYEVAANAGYGPALFMLGNLHREGRGAPRDERAALALYERAAAKKEPLALQALALAHEHGELGLEPDADEARRYAMEAAHALHERGP